MGQKSIPSRILTSILKKFFALEKNYSLDLPELNNILIVRQHNQLGDLLSGVSLFRALKEKYPDSKISLIVSPTNYHGIIKNEFIDEYFVFDQKKLFNPFYLQSLVKVLKHNYDLAIVPVVVSISFTSNLLARLSNSAIRIGCESLDGIENESNFLFDRTVPLDWRNHPDSNVSERSLDIVRPFGVDTENFKSNIKFDDADRTVAERFLDEIKRNNSTYLIGLHVGAGKPPNRWSLENYVELINRISKAFSCIFYLTGTNSDLGEVSFVKSKSNAEVHSFLNKTIPQVAALISSTDLFISNDTGIMHVAGTTDTSQISIFGPTNPFNWAPIGANKFFLRKSEFIDDVYVDEVFQLASEILTKIE